MAQSTGRRPPVARVLVLVAAAVLFVVPSPAEAAAAPLPSDGVLSVDGHGWGHGRGMGQYGAKGMAAAGKTWSQIVTHYYSGVTIGSRSTSETIRVHVETSSDVVVAADGTVTASWVGGGSFASSDATYRYLRARHNGSAYILEKATGHTGPWTAVTSGTAPIRFRPSGTLIQLIKNSGEVRYYRGSIEARRTGTTSLYSINELALQHYLYGVVPREMPSGWAAEALRAQSVAARSYTAYKKDAARARGDVFDICSTTSCQVYGGAAWKTSPGAEGTNLEQSATNAAVDATAGKVLLASGKPILAEYSSSTGGYSAPGTVSYLKAVPDPYDSVSPHHRWGSRITVAEIEKAWPAIGRLTGVTVTKRNGYGDWGGRVLEMTIAGTKSSVRISGSAFRSAFAWPERSGGVKSNWFRIDTWFGAVVGAPSAPAIVAGGDGVAVVQVRNLGTTSWPVGGNVRLGTASASRFAGSGWISPTRAAAVGGNATSPGKTSVAPGEIATFRVPIHAGLLPPGVYQESFRVYVEGVTPATTSFGLTVPIVSAAVGVVRGNDWYLKVDGGTYRTFTFGHDTDKKLAGDWNGDGIDSPGVVRASGNYLVWYLNDGFDGTAETVLGYGLTTDRPVAGDWNGDGTDTPGVARANGKYLVWHLNDGLDGTADTVVGYGLGSDRPVAGDWDGDGDVTPGVVRASGDYLVWYLNNDFDGTPDVRVTFGLASDKPVAGDWNGDGVSTPGVMRGHTWHLTNGFDASADISFGFGLAGDVPIAGDWDGPTPQRPAIVRRTAWHLNAGLDGTPELIFGYGLSGDGFVVGDWDGDGVQTPGVYRGHTWYVNNGFDGTEDRIFGYGLDGDMPVVGDWDGDGVQTPGIVRGSTWHLNNGFDGTADIIVTFGASGVPVVGDWDGDGTETPGVVSGNTWSLANDFDGVPDRTVQFGEIGAVPVAGDWNGDGVATPGTFHDGEWHVADGPTLAFSFGTAGDTPIAGRWIP